MMKKLFAILITLSMLLSARPVLAGNTIEAHGIGSREFDYMSDRIKKKYGYKK